MLMDPPGRSTNGRSNVHGPRECRVPASERVGDRPVNVGGPTLAVVAPDARDSGITLAEVLAAYSLATDLGLGQPMEHLLRSWRIASRLGAHVGLPEDEQASLFYVAMLSWVGCVADAPEVSTFFGDDIAFRADSYDVDLGGVPGYRFFLSHAGAGGSPATRVKVAGTILATGGRQVMRGIQSHCLIASTLAGRLGLDEAVAGAVRQFFARWDGRGVPDGVAGADLSLWVRLFHVGDVAEVHYRRGGLDAARGVARERRGTQFDPALVDAFCDIAAEVLPGLHGEYDVNALLADAPGLRQPLSDDALDEALGALADFTDLRSPDRAGHSGAVAGLAGAAAQRLGLPAADATATRRAGFVHDIGLHGVPATILDKPGELSATEWERVRLSSYYTERVLARPATLARIGAIASYAHERMDGSGYHRGAGGASIPMTGRVLAAACAFRSLVEPRAGRAPGSAKEAAAALRVEARAGRLDADAADAVLAAAGAGGRRRVAGPAGLTAREVEVLVLIARGAATNEVAAQLGVSRKTAATHVERIYLKTGASSRSAATLFALRNGLLDPLET
jgi:HD-GYP domain-containing protein (c-di-GMP phosphodiesterase class II)/DNA-binding CsgD family transcriptional regulator